MSQPRASIRMRLTLMYTAVFVVAFAAIMGVSYYLVKDRTGGARTAVSVICTRDGQHVQAGFASGSASGSGSATIAPNGNASGTCANAVGHASSGTFFYQGPTPPAGSVPGPAAIQQLTRAVNASRNQTLNTLLVVMFAALGVMTVLALGLGWWMAGRALKPVHRITETARRLSDQTLHDRINLDGPKDELKELADTFDAMLSRLDRAFTSQRRFVANASHELRTPLATDRVLVDEALANDEATVEDLRSILEQLRTNGEESERLINALLALARSERGVDVWLPVDLATAAGNATDRCAAEAARLGVQVRSDLAAAPTEGDPDLLERLASNLVDNAVRHNQPDGWVSVTTGVDHDHAYLEVGNTGPVVDPAEARRLLEPFKRGGTDRDSSTDGFGLGLSIVDAIVTAHGGRLEIRARPEGGLDVRADLGARVPQPVAAP